MTTYNSVRVTDKKLKIYYDNLSNPLKFIIGFVVGYFSMQILFFIAGLISILMGA